MFKRYLPGLFIGLSNMPLSFVTPVDTGFMESVLLKILTVAYISASPRESVTHPFTLKTSAIATNELKTRAAASVQILKLVINIS
jgi:hypothetical protein